MMNEEEREKENPEKDEPRETKKPRVLVVRRLCNVLDLEGGDDGLFVEIRIRRDSVVSLRRAAASRTTRSK